MYKNFASKEDAESYIKEELSADFYEVYWEGAGSYWCYVKSQRCPRGCCYDQIGTAVRTTHRVEELRSELRDLAAKLKEAQQYDNANS